MSLLETTVVVSEVYQTKIDGFFLSRDIADY